MVRTISTGVLCQHDFIYPIIIPSSSLKSHRQLSHPAMSGSRMTAFSTDAGNMADPRRSEQSEQSRAADFGRLSTSSRERRTASPRQTSPYRKRVFGPVKHLVLPILIRHGKSLDTALVVREESPWNTYMKIYECDLGAPLDIASPLHSPTRLVAIKTVQTDDIQQTLRFLEDMQHPNILSTQECFVDQGTVSILYNDIQISLDHLAACEAYLLEVQLAAVLAQVICLCSPSLYTRVHPMLRVVEDP